MLFSYETTPLEDAAIEQKLALVNVERMIQDYARYTAQDLFNVWVQSMLFNHIHDLQVAKQLVVEDYIDVHNRFGAPAPVPHVEEVKPWADQPEPERVPEDPEDAKPQSVPTPPSKWEEYFPLPLWKRIAGRQ